MSQYVLTLVTEDGSPFADDTETYYNRGRAERQAVSLSRMFQGMIVRLVSNDTDKVKHYRYGRIYKLK